MGHSQVQKEETHKRIVQIASQRLREAGLDGVGVADLMNEAGLTVGGFYKHFQSREDLVVEAISAAFRTWQDQIDDAAARGTPATLGEILDAYLSEAHRDAPGSGCAVGALMGDVARSSPRTQSLYTDQVQRNITTLSGRLGGEDPAARRARAILMLSALIGAVGLSRAVSDDALSCEILAAVRMQLKALEGA